MLDRFATEAILVVKQLHAMEQLSVEVNQTSSWYTPFVSGFLANRNCVPVDTLEGTNFSTKNKYQGLTEGGCM